MNTKTVRTNLVIRIAFALIFIFLFVSVVNLQVEMNELRKLRDEKVNLLNELQDDNDELTQRISEPLNEENIVKMARKLGYNKANEIIFLNDMAN